MNQINVLPHLLSSKKKKKKKQKGRTDTYQFLRCSQNHLQRHVHSVKSHCFYTVRCPRNVGTLYRHLTSPFAISNKSARCEQLMYLSNLIKRIAYVEKNSDENNIRNKPKGERLT